MATFRYRGAGASDDQRTLQWIFFALLIQAYSPFTMFLTRPQAKAAFNHVLDNVLGQDDDLALKQSLIAEGIEDILSLGSIGVTTIDSLTYDRSATETRAPVGKGDKNLLKILIAYIFYARSNGIHF